MALIEGDAGIGKTTLANAAIDLALSRGYRVAVTRMSEPDTGASYTGLGDILGDVPTRILEGLPAPQRDALDAALLRAAPEDSAQGARAVSMATLAVLRALSDRRPVLIAVDDLQWIDSSTGFALAFALRRLQTEAVGFIATKRLGTTPPPAARELERALPADRLTRLHIRSLTAAATRALLRDGLSAELPHSVSARIHTLSQGNPFYALEIGREVLRQGVPAPGAPLPVPDAASDILRQRIALLSAPTISVLRVAASAARPTVELIRRAAPQLDVDAALVEAERAGLVVVEEGRVGFRHPLFASAISASMPAPDLRALHRTLAAVSTDEEERARHLALSSLGPDGEIAAALQSAALRARRRGAGADAAELASLAAVHTPLDQASDRARRTVNAAMFAFEAGDANRAESLLEGAVRTSRPGPERAEVLNSICEMSWQDTVRVEHYARMAIAEAGDDGPLAAAANGSLAWAALYRGQLATAVERAADAIQLAESDPVELADALSISALSGFLLGRPPAAELDRAIELQEQAEDTALVVYSKPGVVRGLASMWAGDLASARHQLEEQLASFESQGRFVARDEVLCYLAQLECRAGDWKRAEAHADECLEIGEESGHLRGRGQSLYPRAWVSALLGDLAAARAQAGDGLALSSECQDRLAAAGNAGVLTLVELTDDNAAAAARHGAIVVDFLCQSGAVEPGVVPFIADVVEARIAVGDLAGARAIVEDERLMGRLASHPGSRVTSPRAEALVLAADGDLGAALDLLDASIDGPEVAAQPFELARALLVRGGVRRRSRHKSRAAADLEAARAAFESLGAVAWATRAHRELARVTGGRPGKATLSPTERRVAELVARGLTNREVADQTFVSVKTVEATLSRVYRKLGIRSRAELAAVIAGRPGTTSPAPRADG